MPLDTNANEFLKETVEDFYRHGTPFTSLDIANLAKDAGHFARNRWVATWLRSNAIEVAHSVGALYNQTLIEVDSKIEGNTLAYLYHHMNFDPDDYLDRDQNPKSAPGAPVAQVFAPAGAGAFSTQDGGTHSPGVVKQHQQAVSDKAGTTTTPASPQTRGVQRDIYGRFTRDSAAPVSKPTHARSQLRDSKGRFIK